MSILIGHPTGNPNSHNAALAYVEAGLIECFCVSWMPSTATIELLSRVKLLRPLAQRLGRRQFPPLLDAPKIEGRVAEVRRLLMQASGLVLDRSADHRNRWLMQTMAREARRPAVKAIHSYEDCSLWPFAEARRLGKACIYDLPTCYYPVWVNTRSVIARKYSDWLPHSSGEHDDARLEQKSKELQLADLTFVASRYVESTVRDFFPDKSTARVPYGVDAEFWTPGRDKKAEGPLRFIYAGQVSLRKGVPLLIEAWSKAELRDAELVIVGTWALAESKRRSLPPGVKWNPPCSWQVLRDLYQHSDVFVFPSFSDGFGLVLLEAMASGLPVIVSEASGGPDITTEDCGRIFPGGDLERLVDLLRWFGRHRDELSTMSGAARARAEHFTWSRYRGLLANAAMQFA
jgi:starch synthase